MADDEVQTTDSESTDTTDDATAKDSATDDLGDAGKQAIDRMKAERNEANKRARDLQRQLEEVRLSSLSEAEKAVELARGEARTATLREVGGRLVDAEVRAAASGRADAERIDALLEGLDRSRFITDDGDVDRPALTAWVERVTPAPGPRRPSGDISQGARTSSTASTAEQFAAAIEGSFTT